MSTKTMTREDGATGGVSKPLRRRSRACRRAPTTLLNADAANFRVLVQQFTGCPFFVGSHSHKGPLTLSFGGHPNYDHNPSSVFYQNISQQYSHSPVLQQQQQQECMYSTSSSSSTNYVDRPSDEFLISGDKESNIVGDEFPMDNLASLDELSRLDSNFFFSEELM